jgi:hypothetical protein
LERAFLVHDEQDVHQLLAAVRSFVHNLKNLNGEYYWFSNETGHKYKGKQTGNLQVRCGLSALVVRFAGLSHKNFSLSLRIDN